MDEISTLKDLYPAFGPDIDQAAASGHAAEDIRASIGRKLESYRMVGMSPQRLYEATSDPTVGAAAESPSVGEWLARAGSASLNRATLGFMGKPLTQDMNPYQSTGSLIAQHFLSAYGGDVPLMAAAGPVLRPLGAAAAGILPEGTAPILRSAAAGAAEGAGFSGMDVAGGAIRGEETPGSATGKLAIGALTGGLIGAAVHALTPETPVAGPPVGRGIAAEKARLKANIEAALQKAADEKDFASAKATFFAEAQRLEEADYAARTQAAQGPQVGEQVAPRPGQEFRRGPEAQKFFDQARQLQGQEAQDLQGQFDLETKMPDVGEAGDYYIPGLEKGSSYEAMSHGADGRLQEARVADPTAGLPQAAQEPHEVGPLLMPSGKPAPVQPKGAQAPAEAPPERPITDNPTPEPRAFRLRRMSMDGLDEGLDAIKASGGREVQFIDNGKDLAAFAKKQGWGPDSPELLGLQRDLVGFAQESKLGPDETVMIYRTTRDPVRPIYRAEDPAAAKAAQPIQTPTEVGFSPADVAAVRQEATTRGLKITEQYKDPLDPSSPVIGYRVYAKDGEMLYDGGKSVADVADWLHQDNKLIALRDGIPGGIIPGFEGTPGKPPSPAEFAQRAEAMWQPEHPMDAWRTLQTYMDYPASKPMPPADQTGRALEIMSSSVPLSDARRNFSEYMAQAKTAAERTLLTDAYKARVTAEIGAPLKMVRDADGRITFLTCASPCEPTPFPEGWQQADQATQDRARVQLDFDINVQQQIAHEKDAWFGTFKDAANAGSLAAEFRSPSFLAKASGLKYFQDTVRRAGELGRQHERFLENLARQSNKVLRGIREGSDEAFAIGQLMDTPGLRNNPAVLANLDPKVKAGFEFIRDNLARLAQLRGAGPEELLPDYFMHVFDRQTIAREAQRFFALKAAGQLPPGMTPDLAGRYEASYKAVMEAIDSGQKIGYRQLPMELKDKFFEHRNGALGYSLDGIKSWNSYVSQYARMAYVDPMMEEFNTTLNRLKTDSPSYASWFNGWVKDYAGLADPSSLSANTQKFLNNVRKFEYVRAIGSFNPTTPLKHIGQQGFMIAQAGPKAWLQGQNLAWAARADAPEGSVGEYLYKMMSYDPTTNPTGKAILEDKLFLGGREQITQSQAAQKLLDAGSWMFNLMRQYTLKTGFTTGLSKWYATEGRTAGLDMATDLANRTVPEAALNSAVDFTGKTAFFYGKADMPMALRGPVGGSLLQFQSYHIKTFEMLNQLAHESGGLAKLAGILAIGAGVAKVGQLASIDTTSIGGTPLDMLSAIQTLKDATDGDWKAAKEHAVGGLTHTAKGAISFGPTVGLPSKLAAVAQAIPGLVQGDVHAAQVAQNLFERELLPVEVERGVQAYRNYMLTPGADPAGLIEEMSGFPNSQVRVRLAIAQAYRDGNPKKAEDLRNAYVRLIGPVPLDMANVRSAASAAYAMKAIKDAQAKKAATDADPLAKLKRTLPENIRRMIP